MASSCTCEPKFLQRLGREVIVLEFAWTAHTDGSFDSVSTDDFDFGTRTLTQIIKGKRIIGAKTIPGSVTAPTADYDVSVVDSDSNDVFTGLLYDRSATATQYISTSGFVFIESALAVDILNNSVNSATGTVKLIFV